jgi:hypothetical protein
MANVYVDSNAAGAATGVDWANAYLTLAAALTGSSAAGNDYWVAHNHAESSAAAQTFTSAGTVASPCRIICVNSAGTVPPVSADLRTTATVTTTLGNGMTFTGFTYVYGITFNCGSGANSAQIVLGDASNFLYIFDSCALKKLGTVSATNAFGMGRQAGAGRCRLVLTNTPLTFGATGDLINLKSIDLIWRNTASGIGGTVPTILFSGGNNVGGQALIEGVDLSATTGTLVDNFNSPRRFIFKDCKLGAAVTIQATQTNPGSAETLVINSDSAATNYRQEKYSHLGNQTVETAIIRSGGAYDGANRVAWKIVTGANAKFYMPFESMPMSFWNDSTASVTVTMYGVWGGAAVPNNDDIWFEVEYLGSALTPVGSFQSCAKADVLATNAALTADTASVWGGSTTKFKMTNTFTPAMKGPFTVRVFAGAATSTFYIDPKPEVTVSGAVVPVSKSYVAHPGVAVNEISPIGNGGTLVFG